MLNFLKDPWPADELDRVGLFVVVGTELAVEPTREYYSLLSSAGIIWVNKLLFRSTNIYIYIYINEICCIILLKKEVQVVLV